MDKNEIDVTITPNGEVRVHIKGIKGKKCMDLVQFLQKEAQLGEIAQQQLTSEYYEPEPKSQIYRQQM